MLPDLHAVVVEGARGGERCRLAPRSPVRERAFSAIFSDHLPLPCLSAQSNLILIHPVPVPAPTPLTFPVHPSLYPSPFFTFTFVEDSCSSMHGGHEESGGSLRVPSNPPRTASHSNGSNRRANRPGVPYANRLIVTVMRPS